MDLDPDVIYVDEEGRPIPRPDPASFASEVEFLRAEHAFCTRVTDVANRAFDDQFRRSLRVDRRAGDTK